MKKTFLLLGVVALATLGCKDEVESPAIAESMSSVGSHPGSDVWQRKADMSIGRAEAVAFSIGNRGYIGTGTTSSGSFRSLKDFWEYDPNDDVWTQKADVGGLPRRMAVGFSLNGKGYIGTGISGTATDDFWQYSPASNTWEEKASVPGGRRGGAVGFALASKGYVGTGSPTDFAYLKDFYEYDPVTDSWERRADFEGRARSSAVAFSIASRGYLGTGVTTDSTGNVFLRDFWKYDPAADQWTRVASLPVRKAVAVAFSISNLGFVGTGGSENAEEDFYRYNPVTDSWSQVADFGAGERVSAVAFSIGPKGYVGTGFSPSSTPEDQKDLWAYRP
ncbi:MAG TPA: kelch repeat-containing protein [Sphingobacteriaceae bacterium]